MNSGNPKIPKTTPILLKRDRWNENGYRVKAGEVIDIPIAEAKKLIASGACDRADPLPE